MRTRLEGTIEFLGFATGDSKGSFERMAEKVKEELPQLMTLGTESYFSKRGLPSSKSAMPKSIRGKPMRKLKPRCGSSNWYQLAPWLSCGVRASQTFKAM
jgi:hypothetical protein